MIDISYCSGTSNALILDSTVLMSSPFYESDANAWHILYASDFLDGSIEKKTLRVRLFQSSGAWSAFEIRNIKIVGAIRKSSLMDQNQCAVVKVNNLIKQDVKLMLN